MHKQLRYPGAALLPGLFLASLLALLFADPVIAVRRSVAQTPTLSAQTTNPSAQTPTPSAQTTTPSAQTPTPSAQTTTPSAQAATPSAQSATLIGRWRVKFAYSGLEKNLIFEAKAKGSGSFMLLDTDLDNGPVANAALSVWSQLTNDRVSFSGEAELPIGTCCREIGTLIFKGRFVSRDTISGRLIFVTSVDEDESPYKLRSVIGAFTATREH